MGRAPACAEGFKAAAAALGPARDAHVLRKRISDQAPETSAPLLAHLATLRDAATADAQAHLVSPPFQRLLVEFALWLERGAWRANATAPFKDEAPAILHRRQRKLRRLARATDLADDAQLHALRIEAKKLRYAIDFMSSSLPGAHARSRARAQERLLGKLQDVLGDLHDIALAAHTGTAHTGTAHIGALATPAPNPAASPTLSGKDTKALADLLAAHTTALASHTPQLLRRAKKLLTENMETRDWWST